MGHSVDTNDPKQLADLIHQLNDDDRATRDQAANALYGALRFPRQFQNLPPSVVSDLVAATKQPEVRVGTAAVAAIRFTGPAVEPALAEITKSPPSIPRFHAIQALGHIGPVSLDTVKRLGEILSEENNAPSRSAAARALGAIGLAAKPAAPAFSEAWKKHLFSVEDAQALYKIDRAVADELQIPRPEVPDKSGGGGN